MVSLRVVDEVLNGVVLLEPTVFGDDRGSFYESFNKRVFAELTQFDGEFVQDNHSTSMRYVLRGLHYQSPFPQGKLVRVVEGEVWDVAVDLRQSSPTFRSWAGFYLSSENRFQLWVPPGFGHGFLVTSDRAQFLYKTTEVWHQEGDRSIRWDDPEIAIGWPLEADPVLSAKDSSAPYMTDAVLFD